MIVLCGCEEEKPYTSFDIYENGGVLYYTSHDFIQIDTLSCIPVKFRPNGLGIVGLVSANTDKPFNYVINVDKYEKVRIEWDWEVYCSGEKRIAVFQFKDEETGLWETFSIKSKGTYITEDKKPINFRVLVEAMYSNTTVYFKVNNFRIHANDNLY